jgi:hypothetical protein
MLLPREDEGVRDDVGEAELDVARGQGRVQSRALGFECGDWELAEAGRGGDTERLFHVRGKACRGAL